MKTIAIVQARLSSTRLPRKVIKEVLGIPLIIFQIKRILKCKKIDKIVVATSDSNSDDELFKLCQDNNIDCYRGNLKDVLTRFYLTYKKFGPFQNIVRLTGDCPLIDPNVIDLVISEHISSKSDYTSNIIKPSWPHGFDVEVLNSKTMENIFTCAKDEYEREHVTPYIYNNPKKFKLTNVKNGLDLSSIRLTLDYPEDFSLIENIITNIYPYNKEFKLEDILNYLMDNKDLVKLNKFYQRNISEKVLRYEMQNQTDKFIKNEADQWYSRNRNVLLKKSSGIHNIPISMIEYLSKKDNKILEIGCSNGRNLNELSSRINNFYYGVDPSQKAIQEGKKLFPKINLECAVADELPFPDNKFNIVWFGFCLYLVDRSLLMKSIMEADRVLKENGFLIITDFDPKFPIKNKYRDTKHIYSYKIDYSKLFLSNPAYSLVRKKSYSHDGIDFSFSHDERVATWVLYKSNSDAYFDGANT